MTLSQIRPEITIKVTDEHHVSRAQQAARSLAHSINLSQVAAYNIATAVSELANNLLFHTTYGGTIKLVAIKQNNRIGIEIVAEDKGPGIADLELALQDGFTTNGGLGGGLPGVKRLTDEFEINSSVGVGTHIVARKWESLN